MRSPLRERGRGVLLKTDSATQATSATRSTVLKALLIGYQGAIFVPGSDVSGEVTNRSRADMRAASEQFSNGGDLLHFVLNINEF